MISVTSIFGFALARFLRRDGFFEYSKEEIVRYAGRLAILMSVFLVGTVVAYSEGSSPSVATNDATDVTTTSAVLHGTMNSGDNSAAVWFEWGTTTALGARTDAQVYPAGKSTT